MEKKNLRLLIFFAMNGITNKKRFKKIETMNKPHLSKYMLVADIIICTIIFFLILHDNVQSGVPSLFILSFPLFRIWLGFLLYRMSNPFGAYAQESNAEWFRGFVGSVTEREYAKLVDTVVAKVRFEENLFFDAQVIQTPKNYEVVY